MRTSAKIASLPAGYQLSYAVSSPLDHELAQRTPILLLRPLGGSMQLWGQFQARLAQFYQVIAFDPRGVGNSSNVPFGFSTRAMARDAVDLLDHLGVANAHVFGLSLGGMVASWMAIDAPQRVCSLMLASTIPRPSANSLNGIRRALSMAWCLVLPGPAAEVALLHRILSRSFRVAHPARVAELERIAGTASSQRCNLIKLTMAAALHNSDLRQMPANLPTLLLFGAIDPVAGAPAREELQREVAHAKMHILAGAGHDLSLERPLQTADYVLQFLNDNRSHVSR